MRGLSLEAKVGLLILTAAVLLGAFLFVLGGVSLKDAYTVYVDFDNPGSVQPGAAVRVGGVKVGTVEEVAYLGRRLDPQTGRRALVRFRLAIHSDVRDTIHEDALFYVTSQGVLGEQFIAVEPGDPERPPLAEGSIVEGVDPPRLDLALALGYELLEMVVGGVRDNREELGTLVDDLVALISGLRALVVDNRGDLDQIVDNVRTLSEESVGTLRAARESYVDGERPQRIMRNLDRTVALVDREAPALVRDVGSAVRGANDLIETVGPDQRRQIQSTIASAERIATRADTAMEEAEQIVRHVREGRGTVGALLMDEEIYDDLQELIRDLKHNPWKFFWRE
ncbi:MAG: MlaD family protein [Sandaracinaceae bacterium]|nr:MlaD family protein [Sandaracinaceae bacterium]